jgi:hypothetical protein
LGEPDPDRYVVYANVYPNRRMKKIRLSQSYMIDSEGKLVLDVCGDCTIGYYSGRVTSAKFKETIKSYVESHMEFVGPPVSVRLENISLGTYEEVEEIFSRIGSGLYIDALKKLK